MPRLIVTAAAVRGLDRCRAFLARHDPQSADRAAVAVVRRLDLLGMNPPIGRHLPEDAELRELIIPFGRSGYVALYRYEPAADTVFVLAFRHQREAGYTAVDAERR